MGKPSGHVNQRLANLVIDEQLPAWDEKDLRKYKKMYPTSKAWILLESDSPVLQQLTPSVEAKINHTLLDQNLPLSRDLVATLANNRNGFLVQLRKNLLKLSKPRQGK